MILWIAGQSKSGKTTLAKEFIKRIPDAVHLDGDRMRDTINKDLGLSQSDREENCWRIARLASELESQGKDVIVSVIAPYRELRWDIKRTIDCNFIILQGGMEHPDYPFEYDECACHSSSRNCAN
ncbi:MAG TPA: hypothetical protein DHN29_11115 [Cytophagales bacterium]|jgi:adenylylsulfate kinase|nr:hypothetical protein [Cytophagales bacterium]|tara:strand:+ start:553 stop:927 length:375 start_codon:yes stop_codon:yes gene_type:complete